MIIHAPYIHTGGGKSLLSSFESLSKNSPEIYFDKKYTHRNFNKNIHFKIKNNFLHTLFPKKYYTEDLHLFFHGLPPIFNKSNNKNVCFFQNLFLIEGLNFRISLKLFLKKLYFLIFLKNFDIFIVQNYSTKKILANFLKKKNIIKKIEIITLYDFEDSFKTNNKIYDFIYPAEFLPHKNHLSLIEAFINLSYQGIYPKLILTFNINLLPDYWIDLINRNNLEIKFINEINREKFLKLFSQAKCLIFPSLKESLGLPLLEAQSMSIPILASELDFVRDIVKPIETFNPYSALSIQRAIKRYLKIDDKKLNLINANKFISKVMSF